jgi:hypothetical protein
MPEEDNSTILLEDNEEAGVKCICCEMRVDVVNAELIGYNRTGNPLYRCILCAPLHSEEE